MKNFSLYIILLSSLILTSCGTSASYSSNATIEDGIYYSPDYAAINAASAAEQEHLRELTKETKSTRIYSEPADTIKLGEARHVELPLEPEKTYVVLLEGETYEERLNKFDENSDYTFSINFDYSVGYGHNWGWNPYGPRHYWGWHDPYWYGPRYSWGWYDPYWYDPWYNPYWYGPGYGYSYAWGWYDPYWYNPYWYTPYPYYMPLPPAAPGHHKDVIHGRRDFARSSSTPQNIQRSAQYRTGQTGITQIRGREIARTRPDNAEVQRTSQRNDQTTPQRSGVRNYRQSESNTAKKTQSTATSTATGRSNNPYSRSTYQNNSSRSSYNQGSNSSYRSGGTSTYRSSGNSSGGGQRTGGRR